MALPVRGIIVIDQRFVSCNGSGTFRIFFDKLGIPAFIGWGHRRSDADLIVIPADRASPDLAIQRLSIARSWRRAKRVGVGAGVDLLLQARNRLRTILPANGLAAVAVTRHRSIHKMPIKLRHPLS